MYQTLSRTPLFVGFSENEIKQVLEHNEYKTTSYSKGDIVGLSGDTLKGISILLKGCVRGEMLDYSGKAITIEDIPSPKLLAPAFIFGKQAQLPVDIIATQDCEILFIPKSAFVKLMQTEARVLSNFLNIISGRAQFLAEKINFLNFKTIREKYLHFILNHYKQYGLRKFQIPQTQSQLAELFGVSRPALAKVISELNDEGLLCTKGRNVEILKLVGKQ